MNISVLLETVSEMLPDRIALTSHGRSITYSQLLEGARKRGEDLRRVSSNRPLGYVGGNTLTFPLALFTAAFGGVPFVPMNYRVKEREYEHYLSLSNAGVVVAEDRYLAVLEGAVQSARLPVSVIMMKDLPRVDDGLADSQGESADALLLFTSGTSAAAKLVRLTHANLCSYVLETVAAGSASENESALLVAPPYHIAAAANLLTSIYRGRRIVFMEAFDAREWLLTVNADRITHAMVVPTMLARIVEALRFEPELAPMTLRNLSYGGSRPPDGLVESAVRVLPSTVGLVNAYGLTETSSSVAMLTPEDHVSAWGSTDSAAKARLRSVGRAIPGVELQILREDGSQAIEGESGEICIRGSQVSKGYVGGQSRVDAEGWLHTRDLGRLDSEGYLFVDGRLDDLIIRGGENINPHEIESVLCDHPAVRECLVFGTPDSEWGESISAIVTGTSVVPAEELRTWVRARLAGYKVPTRIQWVDELPRNDLGKPLRSRANLLMMGSESEGE